MRLRPGWQCRRSGETFRVQKANRTTGHLGGHADRRAREEMEMSCARNQGAKGEDGDLEFSLCVAEI